MFKTVSSVVAALACAAMAAPSHAQSFLPSTGTLTGSGGAVTLTQTMAVNCTIWAPIFDVLSASSISIPAHDLTTPSSLLCGSLATTYGIWTAHVVPGSTVEIDIQFGFNLASPCYGTIRAQWSNSTRRATFNNVMLLAVNPAQPNCIVSGLISVPSLQIL